MCMCVYVCGGGGYGLEARTASHTHTRPAKILFLTPPFTDTAIPPHPPPKYLRSFEGLVLRNVFRKAEEGALIEL